MKLIVTIDTEEDNWGSYSPTGYTLGNIERIPELQDIFSGFRVKPTYLVVYPIATNEKSVRIFQGILDSGGCEIGAHCHPWNTPPFEEKPTARSSMLCNLPPDLQYRKLKNLRNAVRESFGTTPLSFRAGRWGYSDAVARNLYRLGFRIDTSVTPYTDWTKHFGPDFSDMPPGPYRFSCGDVLRESPHGEMLEVPASVGFLQRDFRSCNSILKAAQLPLLRSLRVTGILDRLRLVDKVWLSPEVSDSRNMLKLTQRMMRNGYPFVNMVFHSSSLKAGLTPFVKTKDDKDRFIGRIRRFLAFTADAGIESIRLSEAPEIL